LQYKLTGQQNIGCPTLSWNDDAPLSPGAHPNFFHWRRPTLRLCIICVWY